MTDPQLPGQVWQMVQSHLGYDDEEMELFKANPRNAKVFAAVPMMKSKTIVMEVVESGGCNSKHTVGTRFYFSGDGNLLTAMAPSKVCAFLLPVMTQAVTAVQELWYAGLDPEAPMFHRAGCFDVGVRCGGWGHIVVDVRIVSREEAQALYDADAT